MNAHSTISATPANRRILREHAREAMASYSPLMTWLICDNDGDLYNVIETQGSSEARLGLGDTLIAATGSYHKSCGDGAALDASGKPYRTQRDYLQALLGDDYARIFCAKEA